MLRKLFGIGGLLLAAAVFGVQPAATQSAGPPAAALYEGARLIAGDGSAPIESSAMLVEKGTITRVGRKGDVTAPAGAARVDLTGKTVMPTLVNAHGHPGFQRGLSYTKDNYTRETIIDDMNRSLYFGIGAIQSQGIEIGTIMDRVRDDQEAGKVGGARVRVAGRGIGSPNAGPGGAAYAGIAYELTTEDQARQAVQELAAQKVDLIKIWVDDRNGRAPKLPANLYRIIIDEGHKRSMRVNAHVFYHTDAVDLVNAGIDGFAHLVRDKEMDDALVASIVQRNVYVMPNISERNTYAELPAWLKDGEPLYKLIQESVPAPIIERIKKSYEGRDPAAVERARTQYAVLQRSTAKLAKANAKIILGSDTGLQDHLFGWAEQREMDNMVKAGLTPMQAIVAATSRSAEFMKLDRMGTLAAGKDATFIVLDANPLDAITNTQRISRVYLKGAEMDRAAVGEALRRVSSN
jgi:imidazolonepropionase-like amidohydrolase